MIVSQDNGQWRNVGANWVSPLQHYAYVLWGSDTHSNYIWSKAATYVDEAVTALLRNKLAATFNSPAWEQNLASFSEEVEVERRRKMAQLAMLEQAMKNQIANLDTLTSSEMVMAVQSRYEDAKTEHARLTSEIAAAENETQQLKAVYTLKKSYGPALENWPNLSREEKRVILHAFIRQIEATPVEEHGLRLVTRWRDDSYDEITLPRQATNGTQWLPTETARLLELVDAGASQTEIAAEFPDRKWKYIHYKVWSLRGRSSLKFRPKLIKDSETHKDYIARR
jgi:hypothetical protein